MSTQLELAPAWTFRAYDPATDEAPPWYSDVDHDCDGRGDDVPGLVGASSASSRGWGSGWPNCQYSKVVTLVRDDGVKLPMRRELVELTALLCDETERLGYNLVPGWCWGFACRAIRGSSSPSNHSWALAVDLNAPENPMGPRTGRIRQFPVVIATWKRYGWRWGGEYAGRADDMHLEYVGTPRDLATHTQRAREEFGMPSAESIAKAVCDEIERRMSTPTVEAGESPLKMLHLAGTERGKEATDILENKMNAIAANPGKALTFKSDGTVATVDGNPV